MATIDDFSKLEIRIGTIRAAEKVENADKLLRLQVEFGDETRQIVSGIAESTSPEEVVGKQCPFITNLEPRVIRGVESQGMILASKHEGGFSLLHPSEPVPSGTKVG